MNEKTAKDIPWLQEPNSSLIESLVTCGLVSPNAKVRKSPKPTPNLRQAADESYHQKLATPKIPRAATASIKSRAASSSLERTSPFRAKTPKLENTRIIASPIPKLATIENFTTPAVSEDKENELVLSRSVNNTSRTDNSIRTVSRVRMEEYLGSDRKFAGRKDAQELAANYHYLLNTVNLEDYSNPETLNEGIKKSLDFTLLTLNKLILQIRGYSEEHAKLLNEIKSFYVRRVEQLPEMSDHYTEEIKEKNNQLADAEKNANFLKNEIKEREMVINGLNGDISESQRRYENLNMLLQETQERLNSTLLANSSLEDERKTLLFKLSRAEEQKNQAQQQATANQEMLDNAKTQIQSQESLIEKYQQEGAGFRPLYLKATEDNTKLKEQIEQLKYKIDNMILKNETTEVEVQTDLVGVLNSTQPNQKRSKTKVRGNSLKKQSQTPLDLSGTSHKALRRSVEQISVSSDLKTHSKKSTKSKNFRIGGINFSSSSGKTSLNYKLSTSQTGFSSKLSSASSVEFQSNEENDNSSSLSEQSPSSISEKSRGGNKITNSFTLGKGKKNIDLLTKSGSTAKKGVGKLHGNSSTNSLSTLKPKISTSKNQIPVSSMSNLTNMILQEDNNSPLTTTNPNTASIQSKLPSSSSAAKNIIIKEPLPDDYKIDHDHIDLPPTLVGCIYRLLPLTINITLSNSPALRIENIMSKAKTQSKHYNWVLQRIVAFFQTLFSVDQDASNTEEDTISLFKSYLLESCGIDVVANKTFLDIIQSCQFYRMTSSCIEFFLQFMLQELSIVDFKFFTIIFNLCFDLIYPPINAMIEDPELVPETPQFLIHINACKFLIERLFAHNYGKFDFDQLRKDTKLTVHPDLVDFFVFATNVLSLFRLTHQQFHSQVKNLLTLVGWSQNVEFSEPLFKDFFVIVKPISTEDYIEKLWERFKLEMSVKNMEEEINQLSFIHFCSDFPEMSNQILALPYINNFDRVFSSLVSPLQELLTFLKKRFTKFVRTIYLHSPQNLQTLEENTILKIRNSLLRCDVSSTLISYRHFLQLTDLKLTEMSPYIVFNPNITTNDIQSIINILHSRENLAAGSLGSHVKINEEKDEEEEESNEKNKEPVKEPESYDAIDANE